LSADPAASHPFVTQDGDKRRAHSRVPRETHEPITGARRNCETFALIADVNPVHRTGARDFYFRNGIAGEYPEK
jgi:hypothetical protein